MSIFKPNVYQKDIYNVNYELLKKKNIKLIIFDLDNTIIKVDQKLPDKKVKSLMKKLSNDFKIVIGSNNLKDRVQQVSEYLECDYLYCIGKPTKKIKKFLDKRYDVKMSDIAIIGDQIITDIFMGNRLSMYTILVDPLAEKDLKITYFNRFLEKIILKRIKVKRGEYYG